MFRSSPLDVFPKKADSQENNNVKVQSQQSRFATLLESHPQMDQSFPYKNHYECYKKLASRSCPMLFTLTYFFLIYTLYCSAAK